MALNANAVSLSVAQANDIKIDEYFDKRLRLLQQSENQKSLLIVKFHRESKIFERLYKRQYPPLTPHLQLFAEQ